MLIWGSFSFSYVWSPGLEKIVSSSKPENQLCSNFLYGSDVCPMNVSDQLSLDFMYIDATKTRAFEAMNASRLFT